VANGTVRIVGHHLPGAECVGHRNVQVGVQRRREVVDRVRGDVEEAVFTVPIEVVDRADGSRDYRGPFAQGRPGDRFVYLSWGEVADDGTFVMFRRAKLRLPLIPASIADALAGGATVQAELDLTDSYGGPLCASIPPALITWTVARC